MEFTRHTLGNGLRILVNSDFSSPMVAMNILYDVGARDEDPSLTGFAHLFEHLMFGGSVNIPDYDAPLQMAGGESLSFLYPVFVFYLDDLSEGDFVSAGNVFHAFQQHYLHVLSPSEFLIIFLKLNQVSNKPNPAIPIIIYI